MSRYEERPWLGHYLDDVPADLEPSAASPLEQFADAVEAGPDQRCLVYFDRALSFRDVDELSDAAAAALARRGIRQGDRVGVMTQNIPAFVIAELATWKLGGIVVPLNPMFKQGEVEYHLSDSGARAVIALENLYRDQVEPVVDSTKVEVRITCSDLDFLDEQDVPALLEGVQRGRPEGADDLMALIRDHEGDRPDRVRVEPDDVALLTYTSGTTGRPKGAMNTNRNVVFNSDVYKRWMRLSEDDVIFGAAPLFHITGLIAHIGVGWAARAPLVIAHRFDPEVSLRLIERHGCTFTVASITAYMAMMNHPDIEKRDLSRFNKTYSGGAPIAPAMVEQWEEKAGSYIGNAYGLTETTSPSHLVPLGVRAPVDEELGALSVGVPVPSTVVRVVDIENPGRDVEPGELGEFWTRGPEVVSGYWERPEETEESIVDGYLRTGDVGAMSEEGWYFIVDRIKDMINASGYKVWPREVEDYLYEHPAVREASVIGVPDEYRGETVKAYVALKSGAEVTPEELVEFCKERMAAYKYPREVEIVDEIPKTATGKFLRRKLREREREQRDT